MTKKSKKDKNCCSAEDAKAQNKWRIDPFIGGIIGVTILLLIGVVVFGTKTGSTAKVTTDDQVELSVVSNTHDWGEININGGIVSKSFAIENKSDVPLKLYDVKTSCMCTTAQLKTSEKSSKKFGMHEKSSSVFEVGPNDTAELLVEFDPAFHGPSGIGDISRTVTMDTNDPNQSTLSFQVYAKVVDEK